MKKVEIIYKLSIIILLVLTLIFSMLNLFQKNNEIMDNKYIKNIYNVRVKPDDNFVFLGDSITEQYNLNEYYEDIPVVNSGIGGHQTKDILENMNERVYQYNPSKVFLLIGINDISNGVSSDEIFKNIKKIVKNIQKNRPKTKIYVESIYPIRKENNTTNKVITSINKKLYNEYKGTSVKYIDINKYLKGEDTQLKDEYTEDGIHLTNLAYLRITKVLLPYLND